MELPKNKTALAVGVAVAAIVTTAALATALWPALTRPDPPLEKVGDGGLRIRLVEPPKAAAKTASLLDVGLSEAAQAMAKGREALFVRTPPVRPAPPPPRHAAAPRPAQVAQLDDEEDLAPPAEPLDDRWEREAAWRRDRFEQAQIERVRQERQAERRRWEEERLVREARDERAAWERDHRRWEEPPERERYDDRLADRDAPAPDEPR